MRKRKDGMNKIVKFAVATFIIYISGCTSIERYTHMHSEKAPKPNIYQYQDGGTSVFYSFKTTNENIPDTYVFFLGAQGVQVGNL